MPVMRESPKRLRARETAEAGHGLSRPGLGSTEQDVLGWLVGFDIFILKNAQT